MYIKCQTYATGYSNVILYEETQRIGNTRSAEIILVSKSEKISGKTKALKERY
jgi:hypothetical protein